jgi:hypothetical protein
MNKKHFATSMVVIGCVLAVTGASYGDSPSDFSSPACGNAEAPKPPAKPQPGPAAEADYYKRLNAKIDPSYLNDTCGTKITTEFNSSWHGHWIDNGTDPGISTTDQDDCRQMLSQIRLRCSNDTAKKSIAAKIKKIECGYSSTPGTRVELRGTTMVGSIGPQACAGDLSGPINKWMDAKL